MSVNTGSCTGVITLMALYAAIMQSPWEYREQNTHKAGDMEWGLDFIGLSICRSACIEATLINITEQ